MWVFGAFGDCRRGTQIVPCKSTFVYFFSTFSLGDYVLAVGPSSGNCSIYWGAQRHPNIWKYNHMSHSLNSLKGDFIGDYIGAYYRG